MATAMVPPVDAADAGPPWRSSTLVGRDREFALLAEAVACPPAVVLVEGEAGVGKTRLASELAGQPEMLGRRFVVGCCRRIREPFPLGPVVDAVRSLGDHLAGVTFSPVAGALRPLLPEIAHALPPDLEPLGDSLAERYRVFRGLTAVLASLGPLVVLLEDLHWADEQTVDFLAYLLADPPAELALVVTFRGEELASATRAVFARLPTSVTRTHVELAPFDAERTGQLAAAVLGVDRVSAEFAQYLCGRASGLPFAIEELLALLAARGTVVRRGRRWARRTLDEVDVPSRIRDQVMERVGQLTADACAVAQAAAVLQVPVPISVLTATCPLPPERLLPAVEEVLAGGLFTETSDAIGFRHVLATQAVYDSISLARRQELHGRAATAVEQLSPVPLGQLAHHLRWADRPKDWADAADRAADQALALGDDQQAVRLLEHVVQQVAVDAETRGRLAAKLGRAAWAAGLPEAAELIATLLDREPRLPRELRGEARFWLAMLMYLTRSDLQQRYELFAQAAQELVDRPNLQAWAMVNLGVPMIPAVPIAEHLEWLRRGRDLVEQVDDSVHQGHLLGKIAMVLIVVGDPEWRPFVERVRQLAGDKPRLPLQLGSYRSIADELCYAGHHAFCDEVLAVGMDAALEHPSVCLLVALKSTRVLLDFYTGAWTRARAALSDLLPQLAECPWNQIAALAAAVCLAVADGDSGRAHARFREMCAEVDAQGNAVDVLPGASAAMMRLALANGDVDAAVALVDELGDRLDDHPFWPPAVRALAVSTEAMVAAGRVDDARRLVARFEQALDGLDAPLAPAALSHARGLLHSAGQRWAEAADHFLAAAELYEPLRCPYEVAQAREEAARALFALDDPRAERLLRAAIDTYTDLGARRCFDHAAGLARRHGISMPTRHRGGRRGYGSDLSPREHQVAKLASAGYTNQEIADQLVVSINTVRKQVSAAMSKLGARSRTQLAQRLIAGEPLDQPNNGLVGP